MLFGAAHISDQGRSGALQASITGLAFGIAYIRLGRIWPVMIAHASFDIVALAMIYWDKEFSVCSSALPLSCVR